MEQKVEYTYQLEPKDEERCLFLAQVLSTEGECHSEKHLR